MFSLCCRVEGERLTGRMKLQHMLPGSYLTLDRRRQHRTKGRNRGNIRQLRTKGRNKGKIRQHRTKGKNQRRDF